MFFREVLAGVDPRQLWIAGGALAFLAHAWLLAFILHRLGKTGPSLHRELMARMRTWAIIIPVTLIPVLLGPTGIAAAIGILGLACYRELSRALGIVKNHGITACVVLGFLGTTISVARQDYQILLLCAPVVALLTSAVSLIQDQPEGYLKRVAFANLGFLLCGLWPGHLGFLGPDESNSTLLLWLILVIALNDVFAFTVGRTLGKTPLCPHTSPGKTREGFLGAILLTTGFVLLSGKILFSGEMIGHSSYLVIFGMLASISGSTGDLILSSIKRDLGLKDLSHSLPGHGGLLDRCDSLIFAAPVISLALTLMG